MGVGRPGARKVGRWTGGRAGGGLGRQVGFYIASFQKLFRKI